MPFENGARPSCRDDACKCKSCALEQPSIFGLGSLASATAEEPHIKELVRVGLVWRFGDPLDKQNPAVGLHPSPAVLKNRQRGVIIPVVNDATEEVRITISRYCFEEVAPDDLASSANIRSTESVSARDDVGEIIEHASCLWACGKNPGQQRAVTAPDIDETLEPREVIRCNDRRQSLRRPRCHRGIEHRSILRMRLAPLEEPFAVKPAEPWGSGSDGLVEIP